MFSKKRGGTKEHTQKLVAIQRRSDTVDLCSLHTHRLPKKLTFEPDDYVKKSSRRNVYVETFTVSGPPIVHIHP